MAACVFCGKEGKLSKEHVWPQWVRPYLEHPAGSGTSIRTIIRSTGTESNSRPDVPANITVKSVCEECNNGWMSKLEAQAKRHLLPLIQGRSRLLAGTARDVIATWIVKTALAAGSRFEPFAPSDFYRDLRDTGRPGKTTRVWIGKVPYLQTHYIDWRPMKTRTAGDPLPERENGFQTVLSCGHLAMYAVGWIGPKPPPRPVFERFGSALVKVWPADEPATRWPPGVTLGFPEGLDELADALGAVPRDAA